MSAPANTDRKLIVDRLMTILTIPDEYAPYPVEAFASILEGRVPEALFGRWITHGSQSVLITGVEIEAPNLVKVLLATEKSVRESISKEGPEPVFLDLRQSCALLDTNDAHGGVLSLADGRELPFMIEKDGLPGLPSITDIQVKDISQFPLGAVLEHSLYGHNRSGFTAEWNLETISAEGVEVAVALAEMKDGVRLDSCHVYDLPRLFRLTPKRPQARRSMAVSIHDAPAGRG